MTCGSVGSIAIARSLYVTTCSAVVVRLPWVCALERRDWIVSDYLVFLGQESISKFLCPFKVAISLPGHWGNDQPFHLGSHPFCSRAEASWSPFRFWFAFVQRTLPQPRGDRWRPSASAPGADRDTGQLVPASAPTPPA